MNNYLYYMRIDKIGRETDFIKIYPTEELIEEIDNISILYGRYKKQPIVNKSLHVKTDNNMKIDTGTYHITFSIDTGIKHKTQYNMSNVKIETIDTNTIKLTF